MEVVKEVNPAFEDFLFDWDSKFYFLVGGYGSSKSYHIALKIILKLLTEKRICLVVRAVYATFRESCYSLFREVCDSLNLEGLVKITLSPMQIAFPNGSRVIFRGLDDPSKLKSINAVSLIWIEEASEISYNAFKELLGRLRTPTLKLHIFLSTNPISTSNWVYKHFFKLKHFDDAELYEKKVVRLDDVYYHHSTVDDNKFLAEDYMRQLNDLQNYDPDLYRIARLGQFGINGVRVLPQFEVAPHGEVMTAVEEIPRHYQFVGLDFGFEESYNAVVRVAVDLDNKILYVYWNYYRNKETDDVLADNLINAGFERTREVIRCDSAEPKAIRYLQKRGLNAVAAEKWSGGTKHARLDNIRKLKRFKKIICSDKCEYVIKELAELTYKKDKNDNIIEDEFSIDAHTLSAIEYALDSVDVADVKYMVKKSDFGL